MHSLISRRWFSLRAALLTVGLVAPQGLAAASGLTSLSGTYSSTIVDWPKGKTGTVQILGFVSGAIDASGRFSLVLPTRAQLGSVLRPVSGLFAEQSNSTKDEVCKGQGTATPNSALYQWFGLQASIDGGSTVALKLKSDTHLPYALGQGYSTLLFLDTQTALNGSVSCAGYTETYTGTFPAGWSLPAGKVTAISSAGVYSDLISAAPLPADVTWHLYDLVTGIGVQLAPVVAGSPGIDLDGLTPGAPAERAGVQLHDLLVEVDGKSISGLSLEAVAALVRGKAGTVVTLGVRRGSETAIRRIRVTRAEIQVP